MTITSIVDFWKNREKQRSTCMHKNKQIIFKLSERKSAIIYGWKKRNIFSKFYTCSKKSKINIFSELKNCMGKLAGKIQKFIG